ncbi:MAG TPA: protein kinase [Candidatus Acidoferrales bacterium]|nr:protein kinase [Candidatus Acidoferrales bacterium]
MLSTGVKLGPYEIVAPIGAGGMGEVYRARDTRLGRDVAIKVLPASSSSDPERLRRFEQEARAAGALNHPNVLVIYDVGSHDGAPYLVTELLEGETLFERLRGGPLPVRKAIDITAQAAQGIAAAHDKGIVHRDLKPANIFLTADGRVKILDFGLAKLTEREGAALGDALAATQTAAGATEPGVVLGTVSYMSPEQVRGKPADARSDIFALGAVLYEMLSGKRAFHRDSSVETMAAILKEEPEEISATNRNVSPALQSIVDHCLEKDPQARFQSARDLAFALEAVAGGSGLTAAEKALAPALATPRRGRRLVFAAIGTLGLIVVGIGAYLLGRGAASALPPAYQRLTFRRGTVDAARFGPDGQTVLYAAKWEGGPMEVYSTRPDSTESRSLEIPPPSDLLAVSPSGEVAVLLGAQPAGAFSMAGTLAEMSLAGGAPREILKGVTQADWSPDGKQLLVVRRQQGGETLEYPIGKVLFQTPAWIANPRISPDGRRIAFIDHFSASDDGGSVAVLDLAGKKQTLTRTWSSIRGLAWSPSGDAVWFTASPRSSRALYSVTPAGRLRLISQVPGSMTLFDVARDGRALLKQEDERTELAALPAGATSERTLTWLDWSLLSDLSPDGKTVLFTEAGEGGGADYSVYLRKLDGSPAVRLGEGEAAALSPNGQWAIVSHPHDPPPSQLFLLPTGAGEPRQLTSGDFYHAGPIWLPDSKAILFTGRQSGHAPRVYFQPIDGGAARPITPEGFVTGRSSASPDAKSFIARRLSDRALVLMPIAGGQPRPIPGMEPDDIPIQWALDGRSIFLYRFATLDSPASKIFRLDLATGKRVLVKELLPADLAGLSTMDLAGITPDAATIVFSYTRTLSNLYLVQGAR